jgi:hypothetical protein
LRDLGDHLLKDIRYPSGCSRSRPMVSRPSFRRRRWDDRNTRCD